MARRTSSCSTMVRQRGSAVGCPADGGVPGTACVVRPVDHVRQARHRPVGPDPDVCAPHARGVHGRHPGRARRGRLGTCRGDREHRRRDARHPVRRRPSGARLEPDPGRLLRPVPGGGRLPDRCPGGDRCTDCSPWRRRRPGRASCSTCLRRASPATSVCDAPGHATSAIAATPGSTVGDRPADLRERRPRRAPGDPRSDAGHPSSERRSASPRTTAGTWQRTSKVRPTSSCRAPTT